MTDFEWTSAIALGHTEIDEQHKRLLLLAEALVESLLSSAEHKPGAAQLQALIEFAEEHFAFEEGLMRSARYPEAERHAKNHASLLTEITTYAHRVERGQYFNPPAGLISFQWFIQHIDEADRDLVVWLKSHESDGGG